ncbi:MAG: heavy metal translocating P-type ATPase, partial [Pseudomonadota bacterium]
MSAHPLSAASPASRIDADQCFHCGEPIPSGTNYRVTVDGQPRALCCRGCQAVAQAIIDGGLTGYYRHRSARAQTARELVPDFLREARIYDHPEIQKSFVHADGEYRRDAALIIEGITCAACVWLNEQHLRRLRGVLEVNINYSTHRARVTWDERQIHLSDILTAVSRIGYLAHPYDPGRHQAMLEETRRRRLRELGVAGVFGMQVMVIAEALYFEDWWGLDAELRRFFYWVSLSLTLPVLVYSARSFLAGAWRDLRQTRAGMDVPIALGILTAFAASVWTTVTGIGTVYYDSVTMFVFLLLAGRYFELMARKRAAEAAESVAQASPASATRLSEEPSPSLPRLRGEAANGPSMAHGPRLDPIGEGGEPTKSPHMIETLVPVAELKPGDLVRVRPGESIPADGVIVEGRSSVDESLLTGESLPLTRAPGDAVIGGSINRESPFLMRVEKTGPDTVLSAILRLLDRALAGKPRLAEVADRVAGYFVIGLLLLAAAVALIWWQLDPARVLPITVAVLVVTCPCALGLATPTALTAATGTLTRLGLLATRGHALERLARATHFVFDKTGTLTEGRPALAGTHVLGSLPRDRCQRIAAALEHHSEHPLARALCVDAPDSVPIASDVLNTPGAGLRGRVDGQMYTIGTPAFVATQTNLHMDLAQLTNLQASGGSVVVLANDRELLAAYTFEDRIRPSAYRVIGELERAGKTVWLFTGDHGAAARHVAGLLGIQHIAHTLSPSDKLARVEALQAEGAVVAMIGDGVNDAPVLARADVSVAVGNAAHVSAASADMVLLSPDLGHLLDGVHVAQRTLGIIRQNLGWAVVYNLAAVPLAAAGLVTPWLAALGMSLSS